MTDDTEPTTGRQYRHDDGIFEVVFEVEEGRVLTVREYPTREAFEDAVATATDAGIHEAVAELPDPAAFVDADDPSDERDDP
ncbi:hypothetical protein [Natronomonas marina]|jgi:hypothetical protein|uniref:hypothetical protein n=1 Tax=Natronomonas marina TaxID=2961939 RepID=UPI0020C9D1B1|nr:hypothetical protein [Natronomonas marina]